VHGGSATQRYSAHLRAGIGSRRSSRTMYAGRDMISTPVCMYVCMYVCMIVYGSFTFELACLPGVAGLRIGLDVCDGNFSLFEEGRASRDAE
jgi:hypothetical protein